MLLEERYVYLMTKTPRSYINNKNFRFCAGNACKASLTPSIRMILPEQELVVKYSSQLLSRDTTCLMSSSTLPFLLRSSLFTHCFFHWLNIFSIDSCATGVTEDNTASKRLEIQERQLWNFIPCPSAHQLATCSSSAVEKIWAQSAHCHLLNRRAIPMTNVPMFLMGDTETIDLWHTLRKHYSRWSSYAPISDKKAKQNECGCGKYFYFSFEMIPCFRCFFNGHSLKLSGNKMNIENMKANNM